MKVTIFGLGRYEHGSGLAATKFYLDKNVDLLITDQQTEEELKEQIKRVNDYAQSVDFQGKITWAMGQHKPEYITEADRVVFNQAVPISSEWVGLAKKNNIPFESEITLFFKHCKVKIIGITGTRGKSTVTALVHHVLKSAGYEVHLGGNIAQMAALELLPNIQPEDWVVLEISNFMLEYLDEEKISPPIAVLTNIMSDHLSRYQGSMEAYAEVKATITKYQKPEDYFITSSQNPLTKNIAENSPAKVVWYDQEAIDPSESNLKGQHNLANIQAAYCAAHLLGVSESQIQKALATFKTLTGRQELVRELDDVKYINDTTATTPDALLAALQSFEDRTLILIAGGSDKGLDFSPLVNVLPKAVAEAIWLPGEGTNKLRESLKNAKMSEYEASSMQEAVKKAHKMAKPGNIVLLSPGCASFGLFKNEFDRGDQFKKAVSDL